MTQQEVTIQSLLKIRPTAQQKAAAQPTQKNHRMKQRKVTAQPTQKNHRIIQRKVTAQSIQKILRLKRQKATAIPRRHLRMRGRRRLSAQMRIPQKTRPITRQKAHSQRRHFLGRKKTRRTPTPSQQPCLAKVSWSTTAKIRHIHISLIWQMTLTATVPMPLL